MDGLSGASEIGAAAGGAVAASGSGEIALTLHTGVEDSSTSGDSDSSTGLKDEGHHKLF